ncbi:MAG: 16S rRNA (cytosine(1402)-N(4))-methyltransferase RsmH [Calditrichaeota bacterium]|nr:MAG: 16S rRNA (cytosine(1402)-N(4))-methyltransferase RsmH [Calditrichota bacterium]MBL1206549.1 16S rRNA (cytosine(1402)-N(4))-methyltransferase RsmH [Calditrichota bacterium]NOG46376.1 16S rRNA (cytosine(1402)-N(4))-methyltransferase RsmH [Calditrichota bacterium]
MDSAYHVPVLGQEVADCLIHKTDGIYLDGTLGGGGHAEIILNRLERKAHYLGVDRDIEAINVSNKRLEGFSNFSSYQTTFEQLEPVLKRASVSLLDGIFLDLGVSSWQIDNNERGFSFRQGLSLDMRMNSSQELTAEWILNNYSKENLKIIFKEYGEERFAGKIAYRVVKAREEKRIDKTTELLKIIDRCVNPRFATKSYARIFQALRIEVNNELEILKQTLDESKNYLAKKGRLAVITYHSLEDRIVKNFMKNAENPCTCPPEFPVCVCGKKQIFKRLKPHFILPSQEEIDKNPRSRSAKLRVAIRV